MSAATRAEPFPWASVLSYAFGVLRLSPESVWAMTPRELAFALPPAGASGQTPGRAGLERLMKIFPDGCPADEEGEAEWMKK
ncbi:MAG: phage tail assembly chaperone [Notoacmeibacter sp.]|nr:phage tail assembly chaperone [Notoacmeibacter sp.]